MLINQDDIILSQRDPDLEEDKENDVDHSGSHL